MQHGGHGFNGLWMSRQGNVGSKIKIAWSICAAVGPLFPFFNRFDLVRRPPFHATGIPFQDLTVIVVPGS